MKKIILCLLVSALCLGMYGCSNNEPSSNSSQVVSDIVSESDEKQDDVSSSEDKSSVSGEESQEGEYDYPSGDIDTAIDFLFRYTKEELQLPADLSEYKIIPDDGTMTLDEGIECYSIGVYADLGERMELMNVYYVAVDNSVIFMYDIVEDKNVQLPAK